MQRPDLIETFKHLGIRVTAQRLAVARVLADSKDHPTAQDVFERVRQHLPHISLATVYNTVAVLENKGLVQALVFADGKRYDTNIMSHANLVCVECGRIVDVDDEDGVVARLRDKVEAASGFDVIGQRLDFYGACSECRPLPAGRGRD
ncbi:MAG TPA: Fur family transcriptional regulator [Dehalococcoidia bacterium]|nr:Fur family transcriptional regulator [Dehalococcoidia bacterium]